MRRVGKWVVGTLALAALVGTGACERGDRETATRTEGTSGGTPAAATPSGDTVAEGQPPRDPSGTLAPGEADPGMQGTGGSGGVGLAGDAGTRAGPGMGMGREGGVRMAGDGGLGLGRDGGMGRMRMDGGTGGSGMEGTGTGTRDLESGDMGATDLDETEPSTGPGSRGMDAPPATPPPSGR